MARLAYLQNDEVSKCPSQSSALLVQLSSAHEQLLGEMDNLDRLTLGSQCELQMLATGRWRIGQASLKRRSIAAKVFDFLAEQEPGELAGLKIVQSADQEALRRSAHHIGNWTMQAIARDWDGYCRASRDIRTHMKRHVSQEQQSFYPLLEGLAQRGI
jgi:hypothetical protein